MVRLSINLGRINSYCKISLSVAIKNSNDLRLEKSQDSGLKPVPTYNTFILDNNLYIQYNAFPYIKMDFIDNKGNSVYNPDMTINFSDRYKMLFELALTDFIQSYKIDNLYYIKNKELHLNQDIASPFSKIITTPSKTLKIVHAVLNSHDEGAAFMINSSDNFCLFSFDDLNFLLYKFKSTNMTTLSTILVTSYMNYIKEEVKKNQVTYTKVINDISSKNIVQPDFMPLKEQNTIPNI